MNTPKLSLAVGALLTVTFVSPVYAELDPFMEQFDKDKNGKLSNKERKASRDRYILLYDRDGSGDISSDERKMAPHAESWYKESFGKGRKGKQRLKTGETRTTYSSHEHEREVHRANGKKTSNTTYGEGVKHTTKTETGREWDSQSHWNNTKGQNWSRYRDGEVSRTESGKEWSVDGIDVTKKGGKVLTDTDGTLTKTEKGSTWETSTTQYAKGGNSVTDTEGEKVLKEGGGYTVTKTTTKYEKGGKITTIETKEDVSPTSKGWMKTVHITRTGPDGKSSTVERDLGFVSNRDAWRWHEKGARSNGGTWEKERTQDGNRKNGSWVSTASYKKDDFSRQRETKGKAERTSNGYKWKSHTEGSNSKGREWTRDAEGKKKFTENGYEVDRSAKGQDNYGNRWKKASSRDVEHKGLTTYKDHKSKTVIHKGKKKKLSSKHDGEKEPEDHKKSDRSSKWDDWKKKHLGFGKKDDDDDDDDDDEKDD